MPLEETNKHDCELRPTRNDLIKVDIFTVLYQTAQLGILFVGLSLTKHIKGLEDMQDIKLGLKPKSWYIIDINDNWPIHYPKISKISLIDKK